MPQHFSQHTHSKSLKHTWVVLYVDIFAMFIASRTLHMSISKFSTERNIRLDLDRVRLTGSTTFLTIVEYVSVSICAA